MPTAQRPYMPDYGVEPGPDGLLDWAWALARLQRSRNYWLGTASGDGRPHVLPVWGVWQTDPDRFVFSCGRGSRKARNLRANPQLVVTTDDAVEVVSVEGSAVEVDLRRADELLEQYASKYERDADRRAGLVEFLRGTTGFELRPERAFGIIEHADQFSRRATRWVW
ncbi:MAG: pyridoxamine 5'-phosphate oxidase family protein [Actinomycetota bacterium]